MSQATRRVTATGWSRRRLLAAGAGLAGTLGLWRPSFAQEVSFFRIGTGPTAGTYFPVGGLIASAISNPPGSRACDRGGACGVPGMIGVAVSTEGSVSNVVEVASGALDSGLTQADVLYWAYSGSGLFETRGALPNLRAIANLFPEAVHIVARADLRIDSVADLKGKRVSLDLDGSGTKADAELVLAAFNLTPEEMEVMPVGVNAAIDLLRAGDLDAFFFVAGTPANAVSELAEAALVKLVPIDGPEVDNLVTEAPFFSRITIPSGTYFNIGETPTLAVGAQWAVSSEVPDDVVYGCCKALWHINTRPLLENGHPKAKLIQLDTALDGLGAPLHPGAERYYKEVGLIEGGAQLAPEPAEENQ
ncbi:MAG: TAXI family TRAP transporter solute-binding subunit [Pseudomonadota bacterium]